MKRWFFSLLVLWLSISGLAQQRKMAAILIGNSAYNSPNFPSLGFPTNDLQRMQNLFTDLQISKDLILLAKNFKKSDDILNYLNACKKICKDNNVTDVLFYYSGHGVTENGENFMIPGDFNQNNLSGIYTGGNEHVNKLLEDLNQVSGLSGWKKDLITRLRAYNLYKQAVPFSGIGENFKDFNLVIISDACRDRFSDLSRSAVSGSILSETELRDWVKLNGNPNESKKKKFIEEVFGLYGHLNKALNQYDSVSEFFRNTYTDIKVRKPVTVLYATNYFNQAIEVADLFSGAFTSAFDKTVRTTRKPFIVFDDNFNAQVASNINTNNHQYPVIDGMKAFSVVNPFIKEQTVNKESIKKAFGKKAFRAIEFTTKTADGRRTLNSLLINKRISKWIDKEELFMWKEFEQEIKKKDSVVNCQEIKTDVNIRISSLSFLFKSDSISVTGSQEITFNSAKKYDYNYQNCELVLKDTTEPFFMDNRAKRVKNQTFSGTGFQQLINDNTLQFENTIFIPSFGTFSYLVVNRISADYDTVYVELPDVNTGNIVNIQLLNFAGNIGGNTVTTIQKEDPGNIATQQDQVVSNDIKRKLKVNFENDRFGYADSSGNIVIEPKFQYAFEFKNGLAAVKANNKWGFINQEGEQQIEIKYDYVLPFFTEGFAGVKLNGKWGLTNGKGEIVIPIQYDRVKNFEEGYTAVKLNSKWAFLDKKGNVLAGFIYDDVRSFSNGLAAVKQNERWGYINDKGQLIIGMNYTFASDFENGIAKVSVDSRYGLLNKQGVQVLPIIYNDINQLCGSYIVRLGTRFGIIKNILGGSNAQVQFLDYKNFSNENSFWSISGSVNGICYYAVSNKDTQVGFIDHNGVEFIPAKYDFLWPFYDGLAAAKRKNKWGFIDFDGKEIIPFIYEEVNSFADHLAAVKLNGKWGFISKTGKTEIHFIYDEAKDFSEGLAAVKLNGKWGFVDKTGKVVIPFLYEEVNSFVDNLVSVRLNGKWGFINSRGNVAIPIVYDKASHFFADKKSVSLGNESFYIDREGQRVIGYNGE